MRKKSEVILCFAFVQQHAAPLTELDGKWIMAYVIAEPCIGVKDTACVSTSYPTGHSLYHLRAAAARYAADRGQFLFPQLLCSEPVGSHSDYAALTGDSTCGAYQLL